jgi:hypothetical protein
MGREDWGFSRYPKSSFVIFLKAEAGIYLYLNPLAEALPFIHKTELVSF